ncbi:MAG TPA: alpha/beta fold hydrolase [Streptosporangiaceae bacterium]|jgi:polyhydroxyalkanoate synthase|nr:alpha/beta fold hydrolase [Streptosporangiaceae bacterium]
MTAGAHGPPAEDFADVAEAAPALDLLLSDAALGVLRRFRPDGSMLRMGLRLALRPQSLVRRAVALGQEFAKIAAGRSEVAAAPRDRRFADPAWTSNPFLKRVLQAYLASAAVTGSLVADADLDWRDAERAGFIISNLVEAAAPSNNPLISPVAWKALIDTGGLSAARGIRALTSDLATAPRIPAMVSPDAFEVGRDLAGTRGAVVQRTEIFELIQYEPVTPQVHRYPLVIVPPMINKFYITDLAPGRSMIEYLVSRGHQVFAISWRNPDARHRDWDLDAYGRAVAQALDTARSICEAAKASICALCSGGIVSSMVAAHLADAGRLDQLATLYLGVTVLDQTQEGTAAAFVDERTAALAVAASRARGYLDGRSLAEVFAWLRPGDLIWNYWVNNYLEGRTPPPFDILYWNADTTRMPAALHRDFINLVLARALAKPDAATMLGSPVDLARVDVDAYVVAGIADHLCPWQSCYRSTQLLGGDVRFVLSSSGHIASMVNPPGNPKAKFQAAPGATATDVPPRALSTGEVTVRPPANPPEPRDWLRAAQTVPGSWWADYAAWLAERSGGEKSRPAELGGVGFMPMEPAPGLYVLDR